MTMAWILWAIQILISAVAERASMLAFASRIIVQDRCQILV
jgi:hypothetical protein